MAFCILLVALASLVQPPAADPARPSPVQPAAAVAEQEDPALIARLEAIDACAAGIGDLSAAFEQRRHTPLLKKPMISSGRVRVKGATIRWDTVAPSASVLVIDKESLRILYPEQKTLEIYPVASGLGQLASSPVPRLKAVREQFFVRECKLSEMEGSPAAGPAGSVALLLAPRSDELKKYVREVRVLLDEPPRGTGTAEGKGEDVAGRGYGAARQVEVTDADGDRTVVVFKEIRTNTGLKDADVRLEVPEGTRVSRPLEGAGAAGGSEGKGTK